MTNPDTESACSLAIKGCDEGERTGGRQAAAATSALQLYRLAITPISYAAEGITIALQRQGSIGLLAPLHVSQRENIDNAAGTRRSITHKQRQGRSRHLAFTQGNARRKHDHR